MSNEYVGIDYGQFGGANRDPATGIHYGVISQRSIEPECGEWFEYDYGEPHCPKCGNEVIDSADADDKTDKDYHCPECRESFWSDSCFPDEPAGWSYVADGYKLCDCLDFDIFVIVSPYYTHAQFCSPCVPGAGNLDHPVEDGPKTYALGHEWFSEGKAPYPLFRVSDDSEVKVETEERK